MALKGSRSHCVVLCIDKNNFVLSSNLNSVILTLFHHSNNLLNLHKRRQWISLISLQPISGKAVHYSLLCFSSYFLESLVQAPPISQFLNINSLSSSSPTTHLSSRSLPLIRATICICVENSFHSKTYLGLVDSI